MIIPTRIITGPTVEPISVDDIKEHLRGIPHTEHDYMLGRLIKSAREEIESETGRAIVQRTMAAKFQYWPENGVFELPMPKLQSVTSVIYTDTDGTETTLSTDDYSVDSVSEPGRVVLGYNKSWPSATLHAPDYPIEIIYVCGYAPSGTNYRANIPENIKTAIKFMVEAQYDAPPPEYIKILDRASNNLASKYRIWGF